ncbi:sigma-54-dependent Fis family transcriptional regulator [Evansella sp. LMS18]|uniref:sigma-54-dependent Fis family transcriptional regulator n=1 Tax=Evansella sp. LMS18 TaxID=2924033 RepID=UPI0020D1441C|nr:sigma-54-dependent Fis family transcriptional regulator [Evansella sp. LMS18]UTR12722.1 sigma-54-dependent Fis family transcriptional regulator [Evansella sp. LMS18]
MTNPFIALDVSSSPKKERVRIKKAWEKFVSGEKPALDIRSLTYQSWERSLQHGVHHMQTKAPLVLSENDILEYQSTDLLYSTLMPLLEKLKEAAIDANYLITFCNKNGEIVYLDGDAKVKNVAEKINFVAGTSWAEKDVGTNGMGTSLATGFPMQIFSSEHFCHSVHNWVCSAAPIKDPATNKILGAANITGIWDGVHPHSLSTVVSIAQSVEGKLLNRLKLEHFVLLEHFIDLSNQKSDYIIAVLDRGNNLVKASPEFYTNAWVNQNGKLTILDNGNTPLEPRRWEYKQGNTRWYFELVPYFSQGAIIGTVLYALPSNKKSYNKTRNVTKHTFSSLIGRSTAFTSLVEEARLISTLDLPVLIEGESGTGKELLAQSIHSSSKKAFGPFVAVNCSSIPKELAVSELFGYEEGAFTGGIKGGHKGKFQQAEGGTIFLDEIGDMPLDMQAILLRVLEEKEVIRLGGKQPVPINVRVIAATNRDLKKAAEKGEFRSDLYYRLNILSLQVPPLRERKEDIPLLINHLIHSVCKEIGRPPFQVESSDLDFLKDYNWPGNIRELKNLIYKMAVKVRGNLLTSAHLPREITDREKAVNCDKEPPLESVSEPPAASAASSLKQQELDTIIQVLNECNGNVTEASKQLGVHRSTIYRKMKGIKNKKYIIES